MTQIYFDYQYGKHIKDKTLMQWVDENNSLDKTGEIMGTLKENAMAYESRNVGNISDLQKVSVDVEIEDREGTNDEGKTFKYKVANIEGNDYRVPA